MPPKKTGLKRMIKKRDDKKYPVEWDVGKKRILIPQQKEFGTYCRYHGCSVTACSIALQWIGVKQCDGTVWNPKEVYTKAKKALPGYNGSKLSIFGCKSIINKIAGKEVAFWYSNNGKRNGKIREIIKKELDKGNVVLFEEKNPIHTVIFLGIDKNGKYITATNGKVVRRSQKTEVRKGLHGMTGAANQKNWWNGKAHGSGFVVVKGDR